MGAYTFKKQSLTAFKRAARPVYLVHWTDKDGRRSIASLGTRDRTEAKGICLDLETLCNNPECWNLNPRDSQIEKLSPKARQIFFKLEQPPEPERISKLLDVSKIPKRSFFGNGSTVASVRNEEAEKQRDLRIEVERKLKTVETDFEAAKANFDEERLEYRKALNKHCTATLAEAIDLFEPHYSKGHEEKTIEDVLRSCRRFADKLGSETLIGKIRGKDISKFVDEYRNGANDVTQKSRQRIQRNLSTFFTWAICQYELSANPIATAHKVAGADAEKEIVAIKDFKHLTTLLDSLKPYPYWRAWVAFATLVGPRWSEQARVRVEDVTSDFSTVTIHGKKTGRFRRVPLEQTILKPILKEYLQKHRPEVDSDLLFPAFTGGMGHGSNVGGQWCLATWRKYWFGGWNPMRKERKLVSKGTRVEGIAELIRRASKAKLACMKYGPSQWRHSAGTAMGYSGVSALRISQWLGNSESVARRFYIAQIDAENWPLKYSVTAE